MNKGEKEAIEELKEFIQGPCEICRYCSGAYRLNRKNIKQLLNLIEKLQKENEELKKLHIQDNKHLDFIMKKSILIQTIKDKIEELNQYYKKEIYPTLYQWSDITITENYDDMIGLLQELLGDK